jgi:hypothetical protein
VNAYLQDDRGVQLAYWIRRTGAAIVGWFATPRMFNQHLGVATQVCVDVHFTYPADGDLHFSFRDHTSEEDCETFETVYSDRVRRKQIVAGNRMLSERPRCETDPGWHVLMPTQRPDPLSRYASEAVQFHFAVTAIPVVRGRVAASALEGLPRMESAPPDTTPIPVSTFPSGTLNIGACLTGDGASFRWPDDKVVWAVHDERRFPHIHLFARFHPAS